MDKRRRKRSRDRSPDVQKKIKGRGVRHESGLRSWKDVERGKLQDSTTKFIVSKPAPPLAKNEVKEKVEEAEIEIEKEKSDETIKKTEKWVPKTIDNIESYSKRKHKNSPVWIHDKFEKMNRSPDSENSDLGIVRNSPVFAE
ncbi:hypothetical protein SteCoe_3247 [Stentor coeruleus]|uniref:Uncharacterized protein n=1 Tax=Stentor coeruleus TaxID=5963 RepID=A0A1R2CXF1_9CILI|nr:hypothetical protein SteCoe_3247 [Stentor coeruleus]